MLKTIPRVPALLLDLDGTLVDDVYEHALAWQEAFEEVGIPLTVWRIHKQIGMSGSLFVESVLEDSGRHLAAAEIERVQKLHAAAYERRFHQVRPLPGARELLVHCSQNHIKQAIATSADRDSAQRMLKLLDIDPEFPIVTCDDVPDSKPHPGLFLEAAGRLDCPISQCVIVGDTVWDQLAARRASTIGVGVLTGGYTEDELCRAGAYRVYRDPAELRRHLCELGIQMKH